ncbi:MAG: DNA-formamidopyrimidine glycosylase [Bacilli bacterium]|nr:DNA-formamidopyrimidine glycosylase [Bacilli bacterium]
MPELPEVETVVRILNGFVPKKTIKDIRIFHEKSVLTTASAFKAALIGETFLPCTRIGKFIIFHLTNDKVVISHLRMEGKYFEGEAGQKPEKHDTLIYDFTDGTSLRFNDVRRCGIVELKSESDYKTALPISKLGKEPWDLEAKDLHKSFKRISGPVKNALLDQTIILGLGNIYADEVLFSSKINPKSPAKTLSIEECGRIVEESRRILSEAIKQGGSTIRSYHPKEGMSGNMQNELHAYGHEGMKCDRCGMIMRKITLGGRGTTYCPKCQPLKGKPFIVGVTGPIGSGKSSVSAYLKDKGFKVLSADDIVHSLYKEDEVKDYLRKKFGEKIFKDGEINKSELLSLLTNPKSKKALEEYIHSKVYERMYSEIDSGKYKKAVVDVPLLIGGPLEKDSDLIILITASREVREQRLIKRNVDPKKYLDLNDSFPLRKAKKAASITLDGSGSLKDLYKQLDHFDLF